MAILPEIHQEIQQNSKNDTHNLDDPGPDRPVPLRLGVLTLPPLPLLIATTRVRCGITAAAENPWRVASFARKQDSRRMASCLDLEIEIQTGCISIKQ